MSSTCLSLEPKLRPPPAFAPEEAAAAPLPAATRRPFGSSATARASVIMTSGSLMARLTPDSTTGLPANRSRPLTPTSVAKITASAPSICSWVNGVVAELPCGSMCTVTPASLPAATR